MNEILDHVDINPRKLGHGRGSARTDALIGPAACGRCPKTDSLKRRASARALSLNSLPVQKKLALQRRRDAPDGPLDPRPKIGRGKLYTDQRLCKRRNIAELRIKQPPTQLSPWRHAAVSSLHTRATEEARTDHVENETK